jgi:hypothetical protein
MGKKLEVPIWELEQREAIQKLLWFKENLECNNERGAIYCLYASIGSEHKTLQLFGGYSNFLLALKETGFAKSYISDIRQKFRKKYMK